MDRLCNAIRRRKRSRSVMNILEDGGEVHISDDERNEPHRNGYGISLKPVNGNRCSEEANVLLTNNDDTERTSNNIEYPIFAALYDKDIDALKFEVTSNPLSISQKNSLGNTPLHEAVSDEWQEGIEELLKCEASPNTLSEQKNKTLIQSPFHKAVRIANMDIVMSLMNQKPDLRILDGNGASIIHIAAESQSVPILQLFLEKDECKDLLYTNDNAGNNILHAAITKNNIISEEQVKQMVEYLLTTELDINLHNEDGETPIYRAAKSGYSFVIELLLQHGSDPSTMTKTGRNTLHAACQSGCAESLNKLIKMIDDGKLGNFVTSVDNANDGCSPFHLAVQSGSIECCKLLLLNGDHLANVDIDGSTRLSLILTHLTSAKQLLQDIFDSHIHISGENRYEPNFYIEYDYNILVKNDSNNLQSSILSDFINTEHEHFLNHPLIESFLNLKWKKIKYCFYIKAIVYFLFLILHTVYLTLTFGKFEKPWYNRMESSMFVIILIPDVLNFFLDSLKYLQQTETYVTLIAMTSAAYCVFSPNMSSHETRTPVDKHIAAISAFTSWVKFMMLIGRFPLKHFSSLGIHIMMLTQVAKSFIKFIVAFLSLLIGFSISFYIIFPETGAFDSFPRSFVKTLMMMINGIEYSALLNLDEDVKSSGSEITCPNKEMDTNTTSKIFANTTSKIFANTTSEIFANTTSEIFANTTSETFTNKTSEIFTESVQTTFVLVYAFLISILMNNLLVGLAINDITEIYRLGKITKLSKQATYNLTFDYLANIIMKLPCFPKSFKNFIAKQSFIGFQKRIYLNTYKTKIQNANQLEMIQDSIDLKSDSQDDDTIEDLTKMFTKFRIRYRKDQNNLENSMKNLSKDQNNLENSMKNLSKELLNIKMMIEERTN